MMIQGFYCLLYCFNAIWELQAKLLRRDAKLLKDKNEAVWFAVTIIYPTP